MKLSEYIKKYRSNNYLSQRQFAEKCDFSHSYISLLEKEINPATGEKIVPTLGALEKLASGMNISLTSLLMSVEDIPIELSSTACEQEKLLCEIFRSLSDEGKQKLLDQAELLSLKYKSDSPKEAASAV